MIQFQRGTKISWLGKKTPLADGQPGFDKSRNKIKIGDGKRMWSTLPYASGLFEEEVLDSEENAKARIQIEPEDATIITYGPESPDTDTIGKLYLQYYDAEPETDYIVDYGVNKNWTYQKFKSGMALCYGTFEFTTTIQTAIGESTLYQNSSEPPKIKYPFTFKSVPSESATLVSPGGLVWLAAAKTANTTDTTATYSIISPDKLTNSTKYLLNFVVRGFWR